MSSITVAILDTQVTQFSFGGTQYGRHLSVSGSYTPNDPDFVQQWGLEQDSDIDADATEAWEA